MTEVSVLDTTAPAEPTLWNLVYVSAAVPGFGLADLEEILRAARKHNTLANVTGILLAENSSFLQVLEGEPAVIDALLERIRQDRRHRRTALLIREPIERRSFADWTMGYSRVSLGELRNASDGLNDFFADHDAFADLDSDRVREILTLFRSGAFRQRLG
jgi:hypothetical protein